MSWLLQGALTALFVFLQPVFAAVPPTEIRAVDIPTPEPILPNELRIGEQILPLVPSDSIEEEVIQEKLKEGVVLLPPEAAGIDKDSLLIFGHSSGPVELGPYREAFISLIDMKVGQEFSVQLHNKTTIYQVLGKKTIWPNQIAALRTSDEPRVFLITCWPLGTNLKRLVVEAELIP